MRFACLALLARLASLVCLAFVVVLNSSCSKRAKPDAAGSAQGAEKPLLVVVPELEATWTLNFNPLLAPGPARWPTQGGVYEPLMIFNKVTGKYVPWLAERYAWSDDNKTLTFAIRDGVKWSDGKPLTVGDVVFTFELIRRARALDYGGVWRFLESVEKQGERNFVLRFKEPYVPGLFDIAHRPIVPEHIWKDVRDPVTAANDRPIGSGPYTELLSFKPQAYELGPNPHYWRGKPALPGLRVPAFAGNEQVTLALAGGEIDWMGIFIPNIDELFVSKDPEYRGYWFPPVEGTTLLYLNTKKPPFDDVRVRKGISMAVDRERIVKIALHGYTKAADATGLTDTYKDWIDPQAVAAGSFTTHDVERGNRLLDEAGLTRGKDGIRTHAGAPMSYEIAVPAGWSDWITAVQILSKDLLAVGIEGKLRPYAYGTWYEKLEKGEFDISLGWALVGDSPYLFYSGLMSKHTVLPLGERAERNWHRYASARADALLSEFERTSDDARRRELMHEIERVFVDEAPAIPLFLAPAWGQYNSRRFTGFPDKNHPYARLAPFGPPEYLLVLSELEPR